MATTTKPSVVKRRYQLLEQIGEGGMGAVYRATDLLSGRKVALKRVTTPTDQLLFHSRAENIDLKLALAQEFRTLASLRHPNIISVLDYGFDEEGNPYFTMDLIEEGNTILHAGKGKSLDVKLDLLIQVFQALAYLHRGGLLHRDMKPSNVLVVNGTAKVLDFGLSVIGATTTGYVSESTAGTIAYLAPELFADAPASREADLYALGVMAYELLTGTYPYNTKNAAVLLTDIMSKVPDISSLELDKAIGKVLQKLLAKSREERYSNANNVIRELCNAANRPLPAETAEIRESYLRAAKFVGREKELSHFRNLLRSTIEGSGSAWLIAGESGVGKTRLVDEIRTLTLVEGATVLRGQAVSEGASPYHVWREVVRRLVLITDLESEEASILKPLVPDIERLLDSEVSDPEPVTPQDARARLIRVLEKIISRQENPLIVILEDLQWARSDSLGLLDRLNRSVKGSRSLILGNYRDDERPDLHNLLPSMEVYKLERLSDEGIADLSSSVLGKLGREADVVNLLKRETEGNPFFLVEVVRTLAEEFGHLDQIDVEHLPETVYAGGVQEIIERRLRRISKNDLPLLQLAAIAGRQLDLDVLSRLNGKDIDAWLDRVAGAAVIDAVDDQWRFSHDKLREQFLQDLAKDSLPSLHRMVAGAIEAAHPDDLDQVAALAAHWAAVGDNHKEFKYTRLAGLQAFTNAALVEAVDYLSRGLDLMKKIPHSPESPVIEFEMQSAIALAYTALRGWGVDETGTAFLRAQELIDEIGTLPEFGPVLFGLWAFYFCRAHYKEATDLADQILEVAPQAEIPEILLVFGHNSHAANYCMMGEFGRSLEQTARTIEFYDPDYHDDMVSQYAINIIGPSLVWAAIDLLFLGYPDQAFKKMQYAVKTADELANPHTIVFVRGYEVWLNMYAGELETSRKLAKDEVHLATENAFPDWITRGSNFLGWAMAATGSPQEGVQLCSDNTELLEAMGYYAFMPSDLNFYASALVYAGELDKALHVINDVIDMTTKTQSGHAEAESYRIRGNILHEMGVEASESERDYQKGIAVSQRQNAKWWELRATVSLCRLWKEQGKIKEAREKLEKIYDWFTEGFDTVDLKSARALLAEMS